MHADILVGIVEEDIGVTLRDRHGANFNLRRPRGYDIGDTAILKADLHVGEVFTFGID